MKTSELKDMDLRELIDQLNSLDFENVGGWPAPAKAGVATLVLLVVLGLGYFFLYRRCEPAFRATAKRRNIVIEEL